MKGFVPKYQLECDRGRRRILAGGSGAYSYTAGDCWCAFCPKDLMNILFRSSKKMTLFLKYTGCKDISSLSKVYPDHKLYHCVQ